MRPCRSRPRYNRWASVPAALSITSVTSAMPRDFRLAVPAKMTSSILPPRSIFGLCSPEYPADRITDVAFAAAVSTCPAGDPAAEIYGNRLREGFEPMHFDFLKVHAFPFPSFLPLPAAQPVFYSFLCLGNRSAVYDQLHDKCLVMIRPDP